MIFITLFSALALAAPPQWKVALVAGDASAKVFDNARLEIGRMLFLRGVSPRHLVDLSASDEEKDTFPATPGNLRYALKTLEVEDGDACFLHLTSHGTKEGFLMEADPPLTPAELDDIVTDGCGERPTVLLISACYSGVFLSPVMKRPHRIILTSARADRTSFGCDDRGEYNFWDECLLENFPKAKRWWDLYPRVTECIREKETAQREIRSYPQAWFGPRVVDLRLPSVGWWTRFEPDALFRSLWGDEQSCREKKKGPVDYYADDVCE